MKGVLVERLEEMKNSDKVGEDNGVVNTRFRQEKRVEYGVDSSSEEELAIGEVDAIESTIEEEVDELGKKGSGFCLIFIVILGFSKPKKMAHFNGDGQPVGEGSISFVSYLGSVMRKHCPISYEHWKDVPDQIKVMIWNLVTVCFRLLSV
ncbi:hypothetical protein IFM89_009252 [Coptis chinensis]|uniref:Uncharacterized protein n=1 Tax=Coptis chinensis TaxID=261450 RepID=A0A835M241_9MAGN|nr:hypothetical protein IFM89_009252 [Coptis chinensis]